MPFSRGFGETPMLISLNVGSVVVPVASISSISAPEDYLVETQPRPVSAGVVDHLLAHG